MNISRSSFDQWPITSAALAERKSLAAQDPPPLPGLPLVETRCRWTDSIPAPIEA